MVPNKIACTFDNRREKKDFFQQGALSLLPIGESILDEVQGEGLVDKIADLGLWPFFSSYACKL